MAITYSLDDFAVTFLLREWFSTLSVEIYSRARQGIDLSVNALSALMFLLSLILVIIYYLFLTIVQREVRKAWCKNGGASVMKKIIWLTGIILTAVCVLFGINLAFQHAEDTDTSAKSLGIEH